MLEEYKITLRKHGFNTVYQQLREVWNSLDENIFWITIDPLTQYEQVDPTQMTYEDDLCFCGYSEAFSYSQEISHVRDNNVVEASKYITSQCIGRLW